MGYTYRSSRWRVGLALVLLNACAVPERPPRPRPSPAAATASANVDYRIHVGDRVQIFVWRNPEASQIVTVTPEGVITTPLLEKFRAAGKTPIELAEAVENALAPYIDRARVSVRVIDAPATANQRVRVVGEVAHPQAVVYRDNMTVLDVIGLVGGLTKRAVGNRAVLLRFSDGQQQQHGLRIDDLIKAGDRTANRMLRPGDTLIIPAWEN